MRHYSCSFIGLFFFALLLFSNLTGQVGSPTSTADAIKTNVFAVRGNLTNGSQARGLAIITGENNGKLYLVTAAALLKESSPGKQISKIQVRSIADIRWIEASIVYSWDDDNLSLLEIQKPEWLRWSPECTDTDPLALQKICLIGQHTEEPRWNVQGGGEIYELAGSKINFELNALKPGSIGAPLINEKGIVGVITKDNSTISTAVSMRRIEELLNKSGQYSYYALLNNKNESLGSAQNKEQEKAPISNNKELAIEEKTKVDYKSGFWGDKFYLDGQRVNSSQVKDYFATSSAEAFRIYRKGERLRSASGWFSLMGGGLTSWLISDYTENDYFNLAIAGGAAFTTAVWIVFEKLGNERRRKAINLYNNTTK